MCWIGLNKEIENHLMRCEPCQTISWSQQKEPAVPMEVSNRPWKRCSLIFQGGNGIF